MNSLKEIFFDNSEKYSIYPLINSTNFKLKIDCSFCQDFQMSKLPQKRYKDSFKCLKCILDGFNFDFNNHEIEKISLGSNQAILNSDLIFLQDLFSLLQSFKKIIHFISRNSCSSDETIKCSTKKCSYYKSDFIFLNFIQVVCNFCSGKKNHDEMIFRNDEKCHYIKKIFPKLKGFYGQLEKSKSFQYLIKESSLAITQHNFLKFLFIGPSVTNEERYHLENDRTNNQFSIIEKYSIINYSVYVVEIKKNQENFENIYDVKTQFGEKSSKIYKTIISYITEILIEKEFNSFQSLGNLIQNFISIGQKEISMKYRNTTQSEKTNISLISATNAVRLGKIFPLLVDNQIEEIYLDSPKSSIYIDHQKHGRCSTSIYLNEQEIDSLKSLIRISGKQRLDFSHPSIKTTISNSFFRCRFTTDISPIQPKGFSLDIRKMNKIIYTIPELIFKKTLSIEIAAFLFFCILNRLNITVIGETSSGKTTLINSLDILVPKHFRRIYIEEVPESLDLTEFGIHQLKYQVNLSHDKSEDSNKTREIYKLLHRNPDIVYLGEILRKEEAHAMFHCLSAGLRGFQTIHAKSIDSLVNRWRYHFEIDPSCFNDLDILVMLKRGLHRRYVSEISELVYKGDRVRINKLYQYNHESKEWASELDFLNTKLTKFLFSEYKSNYEIKCEIKMYSNIFSSILKNKNWNITNQIDIFHKLSNKIFQNKINGKSNLMDVV